MRQRCSNAEADRDAARSELSARDNELSRVRAALSAAEEQCKSVESEMSKLRTASVDSSDSESVKRLEDEIKQISAATESQLHAAKQKYDQLSAQFDSISRTNAEMAIAYVTAHRIVSPRFPPSSELD